MTPLPVLIGRTLRAIATVSPGLAGRLTFRLFCHPGPRAKVRPSEREVHQQATTRIVPVLGHRIAVHRWGPGARPVLMLHGWGMRGSRYAALATELLARGLSPITFDAPGHGQSSGRTTTVPEYAAIAALFHQRYGPFEALVGHSFGALTAFEVLRRSAGIERLVTIGSPGELGYLPSTFARRLGMGERTEADLRRRIEQYFQPETDVWNRWSASHRSSELDVPVLVVHDRDDTVVDPGQARLIAAAHAPRANVLMTSGRGHHRILSSPSVVRRVADFVMNQGLRATPA